MVGTGRRWVTIDLSHYFYYPGYYEKNMFTMYTSFWDGNEFLTDNQKVFGKCHSTVSTIADLTGGESTYGTGL